MIDNETQASTARSARRWGAGAALVAAGLAGGVVLAGTMTANAATTTPTPAASAGSSSGSSSGTASGGSSASGAATTVDPSQPQRSDEKLLTGDTAAKVTAAALATYPNATIERVETDSDGVYEAHIVTTAGDHVIVQVGSDFAVTGTQTGGPGGKGGGTDPDPNDNDGPGTGTPGGSQPGSAASATPSASSTS